jgi:hypothetical protein
MLEMSLCDVLVSSALSACALLLSGAAGQSQGASPDPPKRVEVRHDAAVFTPSVLINLTGYDEEAEASFHTVRERVLRQSTDELPADLLADLNEFRGSHPNPHMSYITFVFLTERTPSFAMRDVDEVAPKEGISGADWHRLWHSHVTSVRNDLAGLELLLAKIWAALAVRRAFRDVEHEAVQYGMPYVAALDRGIEAAIAYLQAEPAHLRFRQVIIPNLLMRHGEAMGFPMGEDTFFTIQGPGAGRRGPADPVGDPHEFLHLLANPVALDPCLVKTYPRRFGGLFRRAMTYPIVKQNYRSIQNWVAECAVKAVACRITYDAGRPLAPVGDPACPLAVQEASFGFLLEAWFYGKLADYEQGDMSFAEWFEQTVAQTTTEAVPAQLQALGITVNSF